MVGIVTTPIPFPLVQMSRTFLFFYIYTLPSALLTASSTPEADLVVLFIVTYGFIGLELISIELDDPFGDDVIDFDTLRSLHVRLITNLAVIFYSLKLWFLRFLLVSIIQLMRRRSLMTFAVQLVLWTE